MKKTRAVHGKNIYINMTKTSALCGCHYHFVAWDRQGKTTQAFNGVPTKPCPRTYGQQTKHSGISTSPGLASKTTARGTARQNANGF